MTSRAGKRARTPDAIVWATIDQQRGVALITGIDCDRYVLEIAPKAPWSRSGHGWVLTLAQVADLACLCDVERVPFRERKRPA
jgi:hypothetical protein